MRPQKIAPHDMKIVQLERLEVGYVPQRWTFADEHRPEIDAYWNVVRARETLEVQRESKALADRTVDENEARVRVGLLPPVAVLEAQADAKSREADVIKAENDLTVSRQRLAQTAYYRPGGTFVPRSLEPSGSRCGTASVSRDPMKRTSIDGCRGAALGATLCYGGFLAVADARRVQVSGRCIPRR